MRCLGHEQKSIVNLTKHRDELLRETAPNIMQVLETALLKDNWTSITTGVKDTTKRGELCMYNEYKCTL